MRIAIEQTVVYGILLLMLSLLILFGLTSAEKGVHSLGTEQAVSAMATPVAKSHDAPILGKAPAGKKGAKTVPSTVSAVKSKTDLHILGKDMRGTKPTWSEQLSRNLEGQDSAVGDTIDNMSLNVGTWLQEGSQSLLGTLRFMAGL